MNKKFLLLLLTSVSTQMHGMEQLRKLKTAVLKKCYNVDNLWKEAFEIGKRMDGIQVNESVEGLSSSGSFYSLVMIEKTLSRVYGKNIVFSDCHFKTDWPTCSDCINEFYEELEKSRQE